MAKGSIKKVSTAGRPTFRRPRPGKGFGNGKVTLSKRVAGRPGTTLNPGPARGSSQRAALSRAALLLK